MDFMKVFDQTVREIKREVNLKVLKVPEMEQKVLDATDNEPWGPHGTALAEIAQATKKFSECQMVMSVLWTRLSETGKDWRYVYKALAVIDYLISNGSERAVDEIIEHTYQISSLTSFEYVEPNGKDVGINVRKKAENIVALLNNKEKISEIRDKAIANRNKYVGLSSTGITYKSGSASASASFGGNFQSGSSNYDSYKDRDSRDDKNDYESFQKSRRGVKSDDQGFTSKKSFSRYGSTDHDNLSSGKKSPDSAKYSSHVSAAPSNNDDDFDDFDPRGTSSNSSTNQVDLFGGDLIGDLLDSGPTETSSTNNNEKFQEADLFADAAFVSASAQGTEFGSQPQKEVDLFSASEPSVTVSSAPPSVDLFASPESARPEAKISKPESMTTPNIVDPFAAVPMDNFDGSDPFGAFTSHSAFVSTGPQASNVHGSATNTTSPVSLADLKPQHLQKKDPFQVKSGIWADSLSRGLIDLNITAPKTTSLADVGVVGGLSNDEGNKASAASYYSGWSMGAGSGLGKTGLYSAQQQQQQQAPEISDDFFSSLSNQNYQSGGFK
ncbi:PREDICTED: clathrin interactor EPSIN 1 isoform X1 [Camelina sativa]|uniref:Clathrin interactor EPSIN 1 isoform X1 n=2 Tax=Camelina sativa TaxID=90675 RepID=A0ABM0VA61_CAMSA|nr:PREDICTED: clathrin interactor EPSIN 1 isoform X1 [Camelina sativa]